MSPEKLNELAIRAGFDVAKLRTPYPGGFPREDMLALESLVELVVQECIDIVESCPPGYGDYRDQIENAFRGHLVAKMKYHFGVK